MVKTAVLVSGGGTNLQHILDERGKIIHNAEIALVISSSSDAYALERARQNGIPAAVVRDEDILQEVLEEYGTNGAYPFKNIYADVR